MFFFLKSLFYVWYVTVSPLNLLEIWEVYSYLLCSLLCYKIVSIFWAWPNVSFWSFLLFCVPLFLTSFQKISGLYLILVFCVYRPYALFALKACCCSELLAVNLLGFFCVQTHNSQPARVLLKPLAWSMYGLWFNHLITRQKNPRHFLVTFTCQLVFKKGIKNYFKTISQKL